MKGKRKAAASPNTAPLSDAMEDCNNSMAVVLAQVGNATEEEKEGEKDVIDDGDNNGENREEGEGEQEEEEEEEEDEEEEKGEEEERPKLDEGFFEIEAIRRKRVRKGQLQYLIKWRGWPETSNTWEPLENLQSCSDVIDAFEERSSRKRKRKYGGTHIQPKKKQPRSSVGYNITGFEIKVDKPLSSSPLNNLSLADPPIGSGHEGENNGDVNNVKTAKKADENGYAGGSKQTFDKKADNEYDPKLSELRGTVPTNDANAEKIAIHFQEGNASRGDGSANELPKVDYADAIQNGRRTGAKRRKSGSVKRFKKDLDMCESVCLQSSPFFLQSSPFNVSVGSDGAKAHMGTQNGNLAGTNSSYKPMGENSKTITKILKPIGFSASVMDNIQEVLVTFVALRSDGKEVMVDNRFLKDNNPLLLIDFYEQHLKYTT
ncbi:chromo domain-containing protein LHP1 isoform X2 [Jatropha curcas]|uniref:chromo domain-containing protein LHP1 isoform X2 n=1 Tax=Jatropha curcas TaxID=180498 RepID=UPI0018954B46|nr:chromo domain-containing protein LHP1 isoform X2 [Jatropha curcas]